MAMLYKFALVTALSSLALSGTQATARAIQDPYKISIKSKARVEHQGALGIPPPATTHVEPLGDKLLAIDSETSTIQVLSLEGKLLSVQSNTGKNGAKLGRATRLVTGPDGDILVLDGQFPRLARFRLNGNALNFVGLMTLDKFASVADACRIGGRLFVLGNSIPAAQTKLIHVVSLSGEISSSFGAPFGPAGASEQARIVFGAGGLICVPSARLVIVASEVYPEVRAYDEDGVLKWTTTIPAFAQVSFREAAGGVRYSYPEGGRWDRVTKVFQPAAHVLGLQVAKHDQASPTSAPALRTIVLSIGSGKILGVQRDIPAIVGASPGRLFAAEQSGFWILSF